MGQKHHVMAVPGPSCHLQNGGGFKALKVQIDQIDQTGDLLLIQAANILSSWKGSRVGGILPASPKSLNQFEELAIWKFRVLIQDSPCHAVN